jgi:hypothetical protein
MRRSHGSHQIYENIFWILIDQQAPVKLPMEREKVFRAGGNLTL